MDSAEQIQSILTKRSEARVSAIESEIDAINKEIMILEKYEIMMNLLWKFILIISISLFFIAITWWFEICDPIKYLITTGLIFCCIILIYALIASRP
jgi:hypothetical protein